MEIHSEKDMTIGEANLQLLQKLIPKSDRLYIGCYNNKGRFIASSCPDSEQEMMEEAFRMFGGDEKLIRYAEDKENTMPIIIGSDIGLQWGLTYESERNRELIFVIGPVFYTEPSRNSFYAPKGNASYAWQLSELLPQVPVMSYPVFSRYVILVHNTLTGEQLGPEVIFGSGQKNYNLSSIPQTERNRLKVYLSERAMLRMVREGNINYQRILQQSMSLSTGVPVEGRDPLRQMKTSIIVFTSLVCRAAMEGGLSPEVAYPLGDSYIQEAEDSRDSGELSALANAMFHDFVYRVRYLRSNPDYSPAIQKCCDYIELSLERKIRIKDLAALVGYTEYYLTEKFKKETGKSVTTYIREAKIERAKLMLSSTDEPVARISELLSFNTPNYFIQCFREVEGMTPAKYRKRFRES